jgi:hypothetical protein
MSATLEKRKSSKGKVPARSTRHTAHQIIDSERGFAGSGPSPKKIANSQKAAPPREDRPRACHPCTGQMQVISALAWMPLTIVLQSQALFVQSLLGLRYPAPYRPLQKKT